jgi:dTDP-4-dehydrorhamnose reductase
MKKILVYGNGFLGKRVAESLGARTATQRVVDESFPDMEAERPDIVINCIGKTGRPNVDWCEDNKPETYFSNVHVPYLLAEYCKKHGIKLVHISSGCIYQGDNWEHGWRESDPANFDGSYYSHSKIAAERLLSAYPGTLILRIRMPIDTVPSDRELLGKLLRYKYIMTDENSMTVVDDFLVALRAILDHDDIDISGTFNMTNPGIITHKEILDIYERYAPGETKDKIFVPSESDLIKTKAPRSNCVLNTDKIELTASLLGFKYRPIHEAIEDVIQKYVKNRF